MSSPSQQQGFAAETAALSFLTKAGLRLLTRNFRTKFGELDLVMQDQQILVFVEVRLRRNLRFGSGAESVTLAKQQRLLRAAKIYLARYRHRSPPACCRFDVVSVSQPNYTWTFDWIRDAFSDSH